MICQQPYLLFLNVLACDFQVQLVQLVQLVQPCFKLGDARRWCDGLKTGRPSHSWPRGAPQVPQEQTAFTDVTDVNILRYDENGPNIYCILILDLYCSLFFLIIIHLYTWLVFFIFSIIWYARLMSKLWLCVLKSLAVLIRGDHSWWFNHQPVWANHWQSV